MAASLAGKAASINVICRSEFPLERTLGPKVGAFVKSLHESKGVQFEINAEVTSFSSASGAQEDDNVHHVHLTKVSFFSVDSFSSTLLVGLWVRRTM